jgi:glycosyltransferase involved in cell wall biosynthesis
MRIEVYIFAWNEADTIAMTIRHYQMFFGDVTVTIFDNYSDDGTDKIASAMGCRVKKFGIPGVLDDREYTNLKNNCWKGSVVDLVIIVDADEILIQHRFWPSEVSIYKTHGWQVISNEMPKHLWTEFFNGYHDPNYSKLVCFNPRRIKEINYVHGCHVAKPVGDIVYSNGSLPLFHYRNVGGPDRLIARHALYRSRMSEWNKRWNAGVHYTYDDERRRKEWEEALSKSGPYSPPGGS